MALKIVWSPEAVEDLESIAEYIGRDSEFYARTIVAKALESAKAIREFPNSGRVVPEFGDATVREFFVYNYRVIYKTTEDSILVVAVIHGKRLIDTRTAEPGQKRV